MKQTVTFEIFHDTFQKTRKNNFSYGGLKALFSYIDDYEGDCDMEMKFDVIGLCCDYTEYDNIAHFKAEYDSYIKTIEQIKDFTHVIEIEDSEGFIIQNY